MKKLLIVIPVVLMMAILAMAAGPTSANPTGWGPSGSQGNMTGGEAPGWSYVSKGNGGSSPPRVHDGPSVG